jgi:hypothetical protein
VNSLFNKSSLITLNNYEIKNNKTTNNKQSSNENGKTNSNNISTTLIEPLNSKIINKSSSNPTTLTEYSSNPTTLTESSSNPTTLTKSLSNLITLNESLSNLKIITSNTDKKEKIKEIFRKLKNIINKSIFKNELNEKQFNNLKDLINIEIDNIIIALGKINQINKIDLNFIIDKINFLNAYINKYSKKINLFITKKNNNLEKSELISDINVIYNILKDINFKLNTLQPNTLSNHQLKKKSKSKKISFDINLIPEIKNTNNKKKIINVIKKCINVINSIFNKLPKDKFKKTYDLIKQEIKSVEDFINNINKLNKTDFHELIQNINELIKAINDFNSLLSKDDLQINRDNEEFKKLNDILFEYLYKPLYNINNLLKK